jgi:hypothetical protein
MTIRHLITLSAMMAATPALAMSYDEAVDGELSGNEAAPDSLCMLDAGDNVFRGFVSPSSDNFTFEIPAGHEITDVVAVITNTNGTGGYGRINTQNPFGGLGDTQFSSGDGTYDWASAMPLAPLTAPHVHGMKFATSGGQSVPATYNWEVTITVEPVAPPVHVFYDEAVDGELSGNEAAPDSLGMLDVGDNVLRGFVSPSSDNFTFEIPAGHQVTDVVAVITNTDGTGGYGRINTQNPFGGLGDTQFSSGDGTYDWASAMPLMPLVSPYIHGMKFATSGGQSVPATYNWEVTLTVEPANPMLSTTDAPAPGPVTYTVDNLTPGGLVGLVGSRMTGTSTPPPCPGLTLGLASPRLLGTEMADASGTATFSVVAPPALAGATVYVQAVDLTECTATPVTQQTFQ